MQIMVFEELQSRPHDFYSKLINFLELDPSEFDISSQDKAANVKKTDDESYTFDIPFKNYFKWLPLKSLFFKMIEIMGLNSITVKKNSYATRL